MFVLSLARLWTGSNNGMLLSVESTGVSFAVGKRSAVDLGDVVAEELMLLGRHSCIRKTFVDGLLPHTARVGSYK